MARVEISYDFMQQLEIHEYPTYYLAEIVSNIGSLMGLFLGLNFTIISDAIEVLFYVFMVMIKNNKVRVQTKKLGSSVVESE